MKLQRCTPTPLHRPVCTCPDTFCLCRCPSVLLVFGCVQLGNWQRRQGVLQGPLWRVRYACTRRHPGCALHRSTACDPAGDWACARSCVWCCQHHQHCYKQQQEPDVLHLHGERELWSRAVGELRESSCTCSPYLTHAISSRQCGGLPVCMSMCYIHTGTTR